METQVDIIFDVRVMLWVMFHAYACKDAQNICATMACEARPLYAISRTCNLGSPQAIYRNIPKTFCARCWARKAVVRYFGPREIVAFALFKRHPLAKVTRNNSDTCR